MDILSALIDTDSSIDLLSQMASELILRGYVKDGYGQSLLQREKLYPTGLSFNGDFNIAIPHTDIEFTKEDVMVVTKISKEPIEFHKMDNPDEAIAVETIFLFAIKDSKKYIQFLSNFLEIIGNEHNQSLIKELSPKRTTELLIDILSAYEFCYKGFLL